MEMIRMVAFSIFVPRMLVGDTTMLGHLRTSSVSFYALPLLCGLMDRMTSQIDYRVSINPQEWQETHSHPLVPQEETVFTGF